ncbi:ATP:cob(I)alamin adenosyltransferase, partial [Parvibaculum sp.]|uniref:ATP:cob(I)alamin adenosyltransferase n=1 Tax=Parvibaculum sp. TaxID=2024848 RepID=UPI003C75A0DF
MVTLNKIYTKTGDKGTTALATGERVPKHSLRIESYGTVDETNSIIGVARLHTGSLPKLDTMLARIQNELFDLGADLATPSSDKDLGYEPLRII